MSRRRSRREIVALIAGFAFAVLAQPALAGTYTINDCPAAGGSTDAGPLTSFGGSQGAKGGCGGGEGDWIGPRGSSMAPNTVDGVEVSATGAATLRGAKVWWYVPRSSSGATTYALVGVNGGGIAESWTPLEQRGTPSVFTLPSGTTFLELMDFCSDDDMGQECFFGSSNAANLAVFGAQLTVEENQPPSGAATGGGLLSHEALSGNESISFQASDADSGVRKVELLVDGAVVGEQDYGASCAYTNFAACPASESGAISWNTTSVADGHHSLELDAVDAANNSSVLYAGSFSTENSPSQEQRPSVTPPGVGGPGNTAAPAAAPVPPLVPSRAGNPLGAELRLSGPGAVTRTFAQRALTIAGEMLGMNGQPIPSASLDVVQRPLEGSAKVIGGVVTNASGSFVAEVPPGPSRTIEIAPAPGSPYSAAPAHVRETVRAGVQLRISPLRVGPTGTITLSGHVEGAAPKSRLIVDLLVHYRGKWVPFRTPRTDGTGHFHAQYAFQGSVGRFPFRAEVPHGQEGLPYASGLSRVLVVGTG